MKTLGIKRNIIVSIFALMLMMYGAQGISYAQGDPPTVEAGEINTTLKVSFRDWFDEGDVKSYQIQFRRKDPQGDWITECDVFTERGGAGASWLNAIPGIGSTLADHFGFGGGGAGGRHVTVYFSFTDLEPGTTYEARYRYTGMGECAQNPPNPEPWSAIAEGTTHLVTPPRVDFVDATLAEAVRDAVDLDTVGGHIELLKIPEAALAELTELDYSRKEDSDRYRNFRRKKIANLTGLEHASQLTKLYLGGNEITDIALLARLTQLTTLELGNSEITVPSTDVGELNDPGANQISDISPLAQLSQLTTLDLGGNQIRDITPLAQLTLRRLNLTNNQIKDIAPLAQWTQWVHLTELKLSRNQIRDITPLAQLGGSSVSELDLSRNQINDVTPLAQLASSSVTELDLSYNQIRDVAPLATLTQLEDLFLWDNPIENTFPLRALLDANPDIYIDITISKEEAPTITASTLQPLTGITLDGAIVKLTLNSAAFHYDRTIIRPALTISGIPGIDIAKWSEIEILDNFSRKEIEIKLTFNGNNITTDTILTLTVGPGAIENYNGPANTVEIPVTANVSDISETAEVVTGVNIPDPNLRAEIEAALGKTSGDPITATEMTTLTSLNAQDSSISNLTGLETATNLTTLKLGDNSVSDISTLAGLTSLTELQLWDNQISNLSILANLTNLTKLYIWGNSISDISALAGLTSLTQLKIGENTISNISILSRLTNLTELSLKANAISDISAVAGLTNLTELLIGNNTISDITPVQNLTNLAWLDMPNNRISDITAVVNLTNLVELYFKNNAVSDLSPLLTNTGLGANDEIDVRGNPLSYPSIYTHIPALQARGAYVDFDSRVATAPLKISGDTQQGNTGAALAQPFVVEVRDGSRVAFAGVPVTFTVTAGGGRLSATNTTTDENGRADSTLTLGNTAGANTVRVSVTSITQTTTFTATATTTPVVTVSPIINRTPQVRDAIVAVVPGVNSANDVTEAHLAAITELNLGGKGITSLKSDDFDGLTSLTNLYLSDNDLTNLPEDVFDGLSSLTTLDLSSNGFRIIPYSSGWSTFPAGVFSGLSSLTTLKLHNNLLGWLPAGIFDGLSSLTTLNLSGNTLDPLRLVVDLERVATGQFKAVTSHGAPFNLVLPVNVNNGTIDGGVTSITIPAGHRESDTLTVTRNPGAYAFGNVSVAIGTLPELPPNHHGYTLRKRITGALVIDYITLPGNRTRQVREAIFYIIRRNFGISDYRQMTKEHLESITHLILSGKSITSLKAGDFSGLSSLTDLDLSYNDLTSLPERVFSGLSSLTTLYLSNNALTSLPERVFSGLSSLTTLYLSNNALTSLPEGVFSGLSSLTTLTLYDNALTSLPEGVFSGLSSLTTLNLNRNDLTFLPEGVFSDLSSLTTLYLSNNALTSLPEGVFSGLSSLTTLTLYDNALTSLPEGVFSGLSSLTTLHLSSNDLTSLPEGVFSGLSSLTRLTLYDNAVYPLPLTVSLEKISDGQFKAVAPAGAPFEMVLPLTVTNGSISGGATTITIPIGSVESEVLTVTRTPGTTGAVTVNIGTLPRQPSRHRGYALVKSADLPLSYALHGVSSLIGNRTQQVKDAIVLQSGVSSEIDVTEAHLTAITSLNLQRKSITSLKSGDFDGLTSLWYLDLVANQIPTLPDGIFDGLPALTYLGLSVNRLTTLSTGFFDGLTTLTSLSLADNSLSSLPTGIFDKLTALTDLRLQGNDFTSLPDGIFDELTNLTTLWLAKNDLTSLSADIFDGTTGLTTVYLHGNDLSALPDGIFEGLTGLTTLWLGESTDDPLSFTVSLEKVADGQFKAVAPVGAPFTIVLPISIVNGSISGGVSSITISTGSAESDTLTVTRMTGTTAAVTVDIGTLPGLPSDTDHGGYPLHSGYQLVKSTDLPLEVIGTGTTPTVTTPTDTARSVNIPDPNLRAKIEDALGKKSGDPISETEMATLTSLNAQDARITNLTGLETATNLTTLKLGNNSVSDISALVGLTGLTELQLWDNQISKLSILANLTNLTRLYIWGNGISDISALAGLTSLTKLKISENTISNISILSRLTNLTELSLKANAISDISALAGLTNLTELLIGNNTISNITPVQNLTNLEWLDMPNNRISDISVVQNLTSLAELYFQNNAVSDLSPLVANTGFGEYTELDASGNPLSYPSIHTHIPALQAKNVYIGFDNRVATTPVKLSGDTQSGTTGTTLTQPFVVEVRDGSRVAFAGVPVIFAVTAGAGRLSATNTTTDTNGRAESTLTLGNTAGTNTVRVSVAGITQTTTFTATATTTDTAPVFTGGTSTTRAIAENTATGVNIGTAITATDADNDTLTYTLGGTDAAVFSIVSTSGQLRTHAALDYETKTTYTVTITASDGSLTDTINVTINITDIAEDEQPGGTTYASGEEIPTLPTGFWIADGVKQAAFSFSGGNTIVAFNHGGTMVEDGVTYTCLSDGGCRIENRRVTEGTIQVTGGESEEAPEPTNTAPTFAADSTTRTIAENTATRVNIGTAITATDADNDTLTYTLGGTDAASFSINSSNGQLQTKSALDYETKSIYTVTITVSDGSLTDTITVTINVTDIDDTAKVVTGVNIPDPNLRAEIEAALGKTLGDPITATEMTTLTSLNAQDSSISNLTGLETATNLTTLKLGDNTVLDISALAGLTNLTELQLWDNQISNLSSLTRLTNLLKLYVWGNNISDISHLSGLTSLTHLRLGENSISNISIVSRLTNLVFLSVKENAISDISAVSGLTNLTQLQIGNSTISDITPVQNLTNLEWLDMPNNSISDISAVQNLTQLVELYFQNNAVSDLSPLVTNTGLGADDELDMRGNPLSYPSIYTHIPALQARYVYIDFDNRAATAPVKISGDTQQGSTGTTLAQPFVIEVRDGSSVAFAGVPVTFAVTAGGGTLSAPNTTTDTNGRAQSTLTLGNTAGANTVRVSVQGISQTATFTATAATANTAPVFTDGTSTTRAIAENTAAGINIGAAIAATDANNDTLTYTLGSTDAAAFSIVSNTGQLRTKSALDYETKFIYTVAITVSDGSLTDTITVTINVTDIDDTLVVSTSTPVSERTPQVRDAIVAALPGVGAANDVTDAHLAMITGLNLTGKSIASLKTGDFDGLSSLQVIFLNENQLTSLPPDVFSGLSSLTDLYLNQNELASLPANLFSGLTVLRQINLHTNRLTNLPTGIFSGLSSLTQLFLHNNRLTNLRTDVFTGLSSLQYLYLHLNQLTNLPAGVFSGLSSLTQLLLHTNRLSSLPDGAFRGLTASPWLWLQGNAVDPLLLTVSLEKVGVNQFKATAPAGVPFTITLPLRVANGNINTGATDITIPAGSVESQTLGVTRTPGTTAAVTVDIGALPGLPSGHQGYKFAKSNELPLKVISAINSAPVFTEGTGTTRTVAENTEAGVYIGTAIAATDADNDTLTFTLGGTDAATFDIEPTTGRLKTKATLDYETKRTYTVTVSVSDGSLADTINVTINISDVDEALPNTAPVFSDGTSTTRMVAENTASGVNIGTAVAATDADNDTLTYTLSGTDAASFSINSSTGQLQTKSALDYETKTAYTVTVSVSDGSLTDTIIVTINVTDIDETPATTAVCQVGDVLAPGESCTYPGTDAVFSVLDNGSSKWSVPNYPWLDKISIGGSMSVTVTINDAIYHFVAKAIPSNSWVIEEIGDDTDQQPGTPEQPEQPQQPGDGGGTPTLTVSTTAPLTEATLDESIVTLTLSGGTYERSSFNVRDAVTVSTGISGVTVKSFDIDRESDTEVTVELTFDGSDFDTNSTITFTVGAGAIADYDGGAITAQIPVTAITESITASTAARLTEATLDGSVVTLTLSGRTFERSGVRIRNAVTVSGISGVTVGTFDVERVSDTQVTVELTFGGNMNTDGTLTFSVGAGAIAGYDGSALTAQVSVSASDEPVETDDQPPDTPEDNTPVVTTDSRIAFESSTPPGYTRVTLRDTGSVWGVPTQYTTDSDVGTVAYMALAQLMGCSFADAEAGRQSKVYIKRQSLGRLSNFASETVCGKTSSTWTSSWNGVRITHLRFFDESSTPNIREAVYNAATSQIEIPGVSVQTPTPTNTAPTFTAGSSTTRTIAENTATGVNIGSAVAATDADNDPLSYTLGGTDAAAFNIDSMTGQLKTKSTLDYETKRTYTATITVSDGTLTDTITVTINVSDVNETTTNRVPVFSEGSTTTRSIAENTAANVNIGSAVSATDADNDPLTYGLSGTDAASFSLVSTTGQLWTRASLDYETKTSYTVTVSVSDGKGGSDSITVTISITDVDEVPTSTPVCEVGDILTPGESCTYPDTDTEFSVLNDGRGQFLAFTSGSSLNINNTTINGVAYTLVADKLPSGSWEIEELADSGDQPPETPQQPEQPQQPGDGGGTPTLTVSTTAPLTEATLDESIVTLTLSGGTYERSSFNVRDAVTVSTGISGVTVKSFDIDRESDTEVTVELTFDGSDFDTNSTITFTVGAGAIVDYSGSALTAQVSVTAITESITASTAAPLTDATLDGSVVTLTLSGRTFERSGVRIRNAVTVSGISGVTVGTFDIDRLSDTQITVELTFDGNINTDSTLTFSVGAGAIAGYAGSALTAQVSVSASTDTPVVTDGQNPDTSQEPEQPDNTGDTQQPETPQQPGGGGGTPTLSVSTAAPLTEATLHEGVVTLTFSGGTYERSRFTIGNALTISGIPGVTVPWNQPERQSDTQITVELEFNGNINTNSTLTFSVGAGAIVDYTGPALTAQVSVSANTESVVASSASPLTEMTLNESVVTLTLNGAKYADSIFDIRDAVTVSGIGGVTKPWNQPERESDTKVAVELEFDGSDFDSTSTLTFTVGADAIAGYNGPALTTQISVSAVTESVVASASTPLAELTLEESVVTLTLNGATYEGSIWKIRDAVTVSGITGVTMPWNQPDRKSDTEITIELEFDGNINADSTLTFTVGAEAIANYNGSALTAQLTVTASREFALAANYPNPFNPETWIPYRLAEDAGVTLTIHALNGRQVRRLKLGHQTAGTYHSRSRAAYWDGKNEFGESVASGVYFYTLTAGDYSSTRKMLIAK